MAQIRKLEPGQVKVNAMPASRFSANATSDSFGGAQAKDLGELGSAMQSFGKSVGDSAVKFFAESQERKDKAVARDTVNQARSDSRTLMSELNRPENRGKAIDAVAYTEKELSAIWKKYGASLKSNRQRDLFGASFDEVYNDHLDRAFSIQEKARVEHEKITLDAENQTAIDDAIAARTDKREIAKSEFTIIQNTRFSNRGLDKAIVKKSVEDGIHNLHASILSAITVDSPEAAEGYLTENWNKFKPSVRETLKKEIGDKAFDFKARRKAEQLVGTGLTEDEINTELSAITDPKEAETVQKMVKDKLEDRKIAKDIAERQNLDTYWRDVMQGGQIPYGRVSGKEVKAMENYRRAGLQGFSQESDKPLLIELGRMSDQELKALDSETLAGYGTRLKKSDFTAIFNRYRELNSGKNVSEESANLTQLRGDTAMVEAALYPIIGINETTDKKRKKQEEDNKDTINKFYTAYQRELNQAEESLGRKAKPEEKQKILDDLVIFARKKGIGWFSKSEFNQEGFKAPKKVGDVPKSDQAKIREMLTKKGQPVTDESIVFWYGKKLAGRSA